MPSYQTTSNSIRINALIQPESFYSLQPLLPFKQLTFSNPISLIPQNIIFIYNKVVSFSIISSISHRYFLPKDYYLPNILLY
jgi:hypothetical protein